jgi:hypothetical protein
MADVVTGWRAPSYPQGTELFTMRKTESREPSLKKADQVGQETINRDRAAMYGLAGLPCCVLALWDYIGSGDPKPLITGLICGAVGVASAARLLYNYVERGHIWGMEGVNESVPEIIPGLSQEKKVEDQTPCAKTTPAAYVPESLLNTINPFNF